jgi:hypothetical protein
MTIYTQAHAPRALSHVAIRAPAIIRNFVCYNGNLPPATHVYATMQVMQVGRPRAPRKEGKPLVVCSGHVNTADQVHIPNG